MSDKPSLYDTVKAHLEGGDIIDMNDPDLTDEWVEAVDFILAEQREATLAMDEEARRRREEAEQSANLLAVAEQLSPGLTDTLRAISTANTNA